MRFRSIPISRQVLAPARYWMARRRRNSGGRSRQLVSPRRQENIFIGLIP